MISAIVVGVFAAILFTQTYTYTVGTPQVASVSGPTTLGFGQLSPFASSSKMFPSALVVSAGTTTSITFVFDNPTGWSSVFSGISIVAQTQAAVPIGVACISLGTGTCPAGLSATFIPASSTNYDYAAAFTAASNPATGVSLQTTWQDTVVTAQCPTAASLGSAATFAVLGGSAVTSTGATVLTGDLGASPGTAITGFPPGTVSGVTLTGASATTAHTDLTAAITQDMALTPAITVATELAGQTLACGVYNSAAGTLGITGTLTLNGDANAVFVFEMASTLTTAAGATIVLTGGATANHVFWVVGSSATLGAGNVFKGTIMAVASITIGAAAQMNGRALATAAVTLDSDTITVPA